MLKDDGQRTTFGENGGTREIIEGRGRCDLLPLDVVAELLKADFFQYVEEFKTHKKTDSLYLALHHFIEHHTTFGNLQTAMLELSIHYEAGAKKYSENNWKKGIPIHSFLDSGCRHALKHLRGDTDEPHDRDWETNVV